MAPEKIASKEEADAIVDEILAAFAANGHLDYGENMTMQEHMLQTAHIAAQNGGDERLVVAALLHDYGHLVCNMPNDIFLDGHDNHHEIVGADALANWFDDDIVNAVRLHVPAKRYLCGSNPAYFDNLSDASKMTLEVQGGPMNEEEIAAFRALPGHDMAVRVRVCDDQGKVPGMDRPGLERYAPIIHRCIS